MGSDSGRPAADLRSRVRLELDRLRDLVQRISLEEVRQGDWFARLLRFSLDPYVTEVDAATFARLYPGQSVEEVVRARTELAARSASVGGALTAGAYAGALAAAVGSRGASSPVMLPAAGASFALDLFFLSNVQLRLAYDIAVVHGVPLDLDDPEDLWRLIRTALVVQSRPTRWEALGSKVPPAVRPLLLKVLATDPSAATRSLPAMGRFLLQRNLVKFAVPGLGLPLSIAVNYWTARASGEQAAAAFRREARIMATARRITVPEVDPAELLWVLWLVVQADGQVHEHERLLLKHVAALVGDLDSELSALAGLERTVDFDLRAAGSLPDFRSADRAALVQAAVAAAAVDGSLDPNESSRLKKLADHCGVPFDPDAVRRAAAEEARAG